MAKIKEQMESKAKISTAVEAKMTMKVAHTNVDVVNRISRILLCIHTSSKSTLAMLLMGQIMLSTTQAEVEADPAK